MSESPESVIRAIVAPYFTNADPLNADFVAFRAALDALVAERDEYAEDVVVAETRAKVAEDDLDKWVGRAESAEAKLGQAKQIVTQLKATESIALRQAEEEREELRDWLFSQKQALDEARAERDRLREAIRTMMALPADARRDMKCVGREALAATTEAGDGRCPKCGMLEVCDDPECPEAGDEQ